jgi:hypothetical protein
MLVSAGKFLLVNVCAAAAAVVAVVDMESQIVE